MLIELEPAPAAAVPPEAFAAHLRLAEGFEGVDAERAGLELCLGAATAAVERMTGRALIRRRFLWTETRWRDPQRASAPISPVGQIVALRMVTRDGETVPVALSRCVLIADEIRPWLAGVGGGLLPAIPTDGRVEIELLAGYGETPDAVPADLRQAVLLLGAHYHEQRHAAAESAAEIPFGVGAIAARYREVRL